MSTAAASSAVNPSSHASLPPSPAPLDALTISSLLRQARTHDSGGEWLVHVVESTGSTNSDLLASVRAGGLTGPTLLVAERQTAGRGRLGRAWASAARASLTASFALRLARPISAVDGVTLVCGLAACDAIAGHGLDARLKWPNDLLIDGRKLAGILVEAVPLATETVLVVGIGINVEPGGAIIERVDGALSATDLRTAGASLLDRNRLAAGLGIALQGRLKTFEAMGFSAFAEEWNRRDAFRDRAVSLLEAGERRAGVERGVDGQGALLVDTASDLRRITSGDVSLRLAGTQ